MGCSAKVQPAHMLPVGIEPTADWAGGRNSRNIRRRGGSSTLSFGDATLAHVSRQASDSRRLGRGALPDC